MAVLGRQHQGCAAVELFAHGRALWSAVDGGSCCKELSEYFLLTEDGTDSEGGRSAAAQLAML